MEWLDGETLSARFERAVLTAAEALEVGRGGRATRLAGLHEVGSGSCFGSG